MDRKFGFSHVLLMSVALAAGGVIAGVAPAMLARWGLIDWGSHSFLAEELRLKATAAQGNEAFVMAAGPVDNAVDGVFCLDMRTGDLTGFVIHPRAGKFYAAFKTNVLKELPAEQGKKPAYAMAVGRLDTPASFSNMRPGGSVIYVSDCNTGRVAAYAFPWYDVGRKDGGSGLSASAFVRLDVVKSGDLKLRD